MKSLGACQDSLRHAARRSVGGSKGSAAPKLANFASSPFRLLVRQLIDWPENEGDGEDDDDDLTEWRLADLRLLQHLPQLTNIEGMFIVLPCTVQARKVLLAFPTQLQSVDLTFCLQPDAASTDDYRPVLQALSACAFLTDVALYDDGPTSWTSLRCSSSSSYGDSSCTVDLTFSSASP